jgi:hypothetical protein
MIVRRYCFASLLLLGTFMTLGVSHAQFLPSPQLCNSSHVEGSANVDIAGRGHFDLQLDVTCDPDNVRQAFPQGSMQLDIRINDPQFRHGITATTIEGIRTVGHVSPMVYISGQCTSEFVRGCRFWLFIADNDHEQPGDTADVVSFLILDADGSEIAYAAAPALSSSLTVRSER